MSQTELGSLNIKRLSVEIQRIQHDIDEINKIKEDAVLNLEKQKRDIRKGGKVEGKTSKEIQENIAEVLTTHGEILHKLEEKQEEILVRKHSYDVLEEIVKEMDKYSIFSLFVSI